MLGYIVVTALAVSLEQSTAVIAYAVSAFRTTPCYCLITVASAYRAGNLCHRLKPPFLYFVLCFPESVRNMQNDLIYWLSIN